MSQTSSTPGPDATPRPGLSLHHVSIPVRDLARSTAFYETMFGLQRLPRPGRPESGVWYGLGERQIHLITQPQGTFRTARRLNYSDAHFAMMTDDFQAMAELLKSKGFHETDDEDDPMRILIYPTGPAGLPQMYLCDPDGHIIEINAWPA